MKFFNVPVNMAHAHKVALRIANRLGERDHLPVNVLLLLDQILDALGPYRLSGDDDQPAEVIEQILDLSRQLVAEIERNGIGSDRVGQAVRNLFENLGAGKEGAALSLRAGEDPRSLQRP